MARRSSPRPNARTPLWFLRIATGGYAAGDGSAAFFPLYPMAIKVLAWLPGVGPLGAALFISNACFLGALVVLHGLTRLEGMSAAVARTSVLLIAIFPTAFFFLAPYTESPFLLLSVSAFWFARRDRWAMAALMGALAALTRSIGLVLVLGLAVEAIQRTREDGRPLVPRLAASAAVAVGPALYFLYWGVVHQDTMAPFDAQEAWQRVFTFPLATLVQAGRYAVRYRQLLADRRPGGGRGARGGRSRGSGGSGGRIWRTRWRAWPCPCSSRCPTGRSCRCRGSWSVLFPAFWVMARAVERRRLPEPLLVASFAGGYGPAGGALHQLVACVLMPTMTIAGDEPTTSASLASTGPRTIRMCGTARPRGEHVTIKVAIADDHSLVRQGLRRYLEMADGIEVVGEAANGQELLTLIEGDHPRDRARRHPDAGDGRPRGRPRDP